MADYYVDANGGDDSTGDGSAVSPWKTIGKAIGSSPAITLSGSGDILHIKGGAYYESVSLGLSPTSGGPLTIVGEGGLVEWFAWTNSTTPATSAALEASNQSYVTLRNVRMIGGVGSGAAGSCLNVAGAWSDWTVEVCEFIGGVSSSRPKALAFASTSAAALNLIVRRCDISAICHSNTFIGLYIQTQLSATEYDIGTVVENCILRGGSAGVTLQQSGGTGTAWSTGLRVQQCTFANVYRGVLIASSPTLTTPVGVYGSEFVGCSVGVSANVSGQLVENGNYFFCTTARTNVSSGANSDSSSAPRYNIAVERLTGDNPRPFAEPLLGSPLIGTGNYGTPPTVDFYGQTRPSPPSIGAVERDTFGAPTVYNIFQVEG